jgi:hypothetical protein
MANGPVKEEGIQIQILKLISRFRKIDYRESRGSNDREKFQKNCRKLGKARM